jgi:SAM-dependent methyltransferase
MEGKLLYIAPERNIEYFKGISRLTVQSSEYSTEIPADLHYDLLAMDCADNEWDYIICHRVIEHVSDDRRAMQELYRTLKLNGLCVLSVPIDYSLTATKEFKSPNPFESDHYYRYGTDFVSRIPAEFSVETYEFRNIFTPGEFDMLNLYDDTIFLCRKL